MTDDNPEDPPFRTLPRWAAWPIIWVSAPFLWLAGKLGIR